MRPLKEQASGRVPQTMHRALRLMLAGCCLAWGGLAVLAQDIHFSQFFNTPYAQNPANIGQFDGDYRMGAVYRQQWRSVTIPYSTFGMGADRKSVV